MTEDKQRVFLLYYSGYSHPEIARMCNITQAQVRYTLNELGRIWVNKFLKDVHKIRLLELATEGYNAQRIADMMGKPWSRWLVTYTLNRMDEWSLREIPDKSHTFRCSICSRAFMQTLKEAAMNPDRICHNHPERRKDERRHKI